MTALAETATHTRALGGRLSTQVFARVVIEPL